VIITVRSTVFHCADMINIHCTPHSASAVDDAGVDCDDLKRYNTVIIQLLSQ